MEAKQNNKLIVYYNNIFDNPIITLYEYHNNELVKEDIIIFEKNEIENGLPIDIGYVVERISKLINIKLIKSMQLLLSSNDIIKFTTSLPKISYTKALSLYNKELKENFSDYKENFTTYKLNYKYNLGYIFYTYFIPLELINFFKKVSYSLNIKLTGIDLFENYIFKRINHSLTNDYVYIYKDGNVTTILLAYNHQLSSFVTFKDTSKETFLLNYIGYIDKHKFELEKKTIDQIYANQTINYFDDKEIKYVELDLDNYSFSGIKI